MFLLLWSLIPRFVKVLNVLFLVTKEKKLLQSHNMNTYTLTHKKTQSKCAAIWRRGQKKHKPKIVYSLFTKIVNTQLHYINWLLLFHCHSCLLFLPLIFNVFNSVGSLIYSLFLYLIFIYLQKQWALSLFDKSQIDHEQFLRKCLVLSILRRKSKLKTHSAEWNFGRIVVKLQSKFDNDNHNKNLRMVQTRRKIYILVLFNIHTHVHQLNKPNNNKEC